jgi:broad specificity phosphatase PhoE
VKQDDYQAFVKQFEKDCESPLTRAMAQEMWDIYQLGMGDHDTPLAHDGVQAKAVGEKLQDALELPDVIYVSPYLRTKETLRKLIEGWPELATVKVVEDERIREQEHGLAILYNDWKIFYSMYPDQKKLFDLEGDYWYRWPQGENVPDVRLRIRSWFDTIVRDYADKKVLVVTHHLTILSLRAALERMSAEQFIAQNESEKPINAGVTLYRGDPKLGKDGKLVLDYYNKKFY